MAPSLQIIVVGAGEVGQHLARILSKEGHGVTVVDSDPLKIRLLNESLDVQGLVGDGTRADVLTQAGATKADLLVAVTDDDHVNMLACLVSRGLETKRRILRLKETRILEGYRSFYQRTQAANAKRRFNCHVECFDCLAAQQHFSVGEGR